MVQYRSLVIHPSRTVLSFHGWTFQFRDIFVAKGRQFERTKGPRSAVDLAKNWLSTSLPSSPLDRRNDSRRGCEISRPTSVSRSRHRILGIQWAVWISGYHEEGKYPCHGVSLSWPPRFPPLFKASIRVRPFVDRVSKRGLIDGAFIGCCFKRF